MTSSMNEALSVFADGRTLAALVGGDVASGHVIGGGLVSDASCGLSLVQSTSRPIVAAAVLATVFSGAQSLDAFTSSFGVSINAMASMLSSTPTALETAVAPATHKKVDIDLTAEDLLANNKSLVRELFTLLESEARRRAVRSIGIRIARFEDPEEGDVEAVVTQTVAAGADEALAYWEEVGRSIQSWTATLADEEARFLLERIAVNIDWSHGDTSAVRPV